MARRRLNKKVALIGSTVFLLLALAAVFVIMRLNRDPAPFVADGDAARAAGDYESADDHYARAFGLTDSADQRIDLLFKLADVRKARGAWDKAVPCWGQIITMDPQNVRARLAQLKYVYIQADSLSRAGQSMSRSWEEVRSLADGALETIEQADLLEAERTEWEPSFETARPTGWDEGPQRLGAHLYFVRGRAAYELASMGAVTSPMQLLEEARSDLQQARERAPTNVQIYRYLADAHIAEGEIAASRGNLEEKEAAEQRADEILAEGAGAAGDAPDASIAILKRKLSAAQEGEVETIRERLEALEPEYEELTRRFSSSPRAHGALSQFYSYHAAYLPLEQAVAKLGQAIEAAERAHALDGAAVDYPFYVASYCYRQFSIEGDSPAIARAIEWAEKALDVPEAQDTPGPTQYARKINRFSACAMLAKCYTERLLDLPQGDPQRADLLARMEQVVHEIGQIQGSGENPQVLKWQGMLALVQGDTGEAIRRLHAAYEQIKAANPPDARDSFLAYTLAGLFEDTSERGAVVDFLDTAVTSGVFYTRPTALLDYADALLRIGTPKAVDNAVQMVGGFEKRFGSNRESRLLLARALIARGPAETGEEDEDDGMPGIDEAIARLDPADPNRAALELDRVRARKGRLLPELRRDEWNASLHPSLRPRGYEPLTPEEREAMRQETAALEQRESSLALQALRAGSDAVEDRYLANLCQSLIDSGELDTANAIVQALLQQSPDNVVGLIYRGLLAEPDPATCSQARRREIQEQALRRISDPVRRSLELASFYRETERLEEAAAEWRRVLDATAPGESQSTPSYLRTGRMSARHVAVSHLFDLARHREDWPAAEEIVRIVEREDLDHCGGNLFKARLAFARERYDEALNLLDECLRRRPVFSYGYVLRGNVKAALGREHESVEDIRRAAALNPSDPVVAKALANALYMRNSTLDDKLTSEQERQTREALQWARRLNPRDPGVQRAYADFLSRRDPDRAVLELQAMQASAPSVGNAVLLGQLATNLAQRRTDQGSKEALFAMAERAFEQARQIEPENPLLLESYAGYLRARGQTDRAQELLAGSEDDRLLWRHYFHTGRYEEAKKVLEGMLADGAERIDALKGLVLVAEETGDKEGVKRYSQELIEREDSVVNRLAQLRAYLDVGLVSEAEERLRSFKEKYPDEPRTLLMEALVAKRQGRLERALELADRSLKDRPEDAAVWRLRGEVSLLMGDKDQAISDLRRSRTYEDNPVTSMVLAKAYLWAGREDEAIDELRRAMEHPQAPAEARTLLEATYRRLGRTDALHRFYSQRLAADPNDVFWLTRAGTFALEQGRYAEAETLYAKAYAIEQQAHPDLPPGQAVRDGRYTTALDGYLRAMALAAGDPAGGGDRQKLQRVFEEARQYVDTSYGAVALYRMAEAKKQLGEVEVAQEYCRRAVEKAWASERMAVEVLLRAYMLLGGEEVANFCRQRLAEDPDSLAAHFTMFNLATIENDYESALSYIDTCIRLAGPNSRQATDYQIKKAQLLTGAHKRTADARYLRQAIAVYESLHEKMPKNSSVLNNLAFMMALSGQNLTEAMEYARRAIEQRPDEANYLDTYGFVLHRNGRHEEAAQSLTAAIQQYEVDGTAPPEVYEHMGMVNEALGRRSRARDAYRRALEVGAETLAPSAKTRITAAVERLGG